ncbi:MAG: glycosyltransferase [Halodesulfurarchaeum sp.]|nr:glycosyltransferase [Halodesulfurarchaeum sp.]
MAEITVAYEDLNKGGGGPAVCFSILEAIQEDHNVKLLVTSEIEDLKSLSKKYNNELDEIDVEVITSMGIELTRIMDFFNTGWGGTRLKVLENILRQAIYHRYCKKSVDNPDVFISVWDEVAVEGNSIQYVHFPRRYETFEMAHDYAADRVTINLAKFFKYIGRTLANYDTDLVSKSTVLANSERTASKIRDWYKIEPKILHPPIDTTGFDPSRTWSEREKGFVYVGRIAPGKGVVEIINILKEVQAHKHDIHLHLVGPKNKDTPDYYDYVQSLSQNNDFVTLEGPLYNNELNNMLLRHKYGISASTESFGMSIAEMIGAGMIPFVSNDGGQREIVNNIEEIMYGESEEAVKKISAVLSDSVKQRQIIENLPDISERYEKNKFMDEIRRIVNESLTEPNR